MLISEKQLMNLISIAHMYRETLINMKNAQIITEEGSMSLEQVGKFLSDIYNQQSDEVK